MQLTKKKFTINDLERLSGVKAHTIRIWEKRHSILLPKRTETNIRIYELRDLQKILNISLLNDHGYKISRIAKFSDDEIAKMVQEIAGSESSKNRIINTFKIAILNFDESLFNRTYEGLFKNRTFSQIIYDVFMPLLDEIGTLRQTNFINAVQEHFLIGLFKEKLCQNISMLEKDQSLIKEKIYFVFFPEDEFYELGLLFLIYEIKRRKRKIIFLTPGFPKKDLQNLIYKHPDSVFLSYFLALWENPDFLREFENEICKDSTKDILFFGRKVHSLDLTQKASNIKIFTSISEFIGRLDLKRD